MSRKESDKSRDPVALKRERISVANNNENADDDDDTEMPTPTPVARVDERTIKRETFEKERRIKRLEWIYTKQRPWVCRVCRYDMYPDPVKHFNSFRHITQESLELLDLLPKDCKEIIVTVPPAVSGSNVKKELSCYGPVSKVHSNLPTRGSHVVIFSDSRSVAALKKSVEPICICRSVAKVRPARPTVYLDSGHLNDENNRSRRIIYHRELMNMIQYEGRFVHQICFLAFALQPSEEECSDVKYLFDDIVTKLGINATLMLSGLEISGAAVEIAIQFQGKAKTPEIEEFLDQIDKKLRSIGEKIKLERRIPEFRFTHKSTGYLVRMAVNDFIGVQRKILLNVLGSLHFAVKLLAYFIEYWSIVHDLNRPDGFAPTAIIALLIYYLQQIPVPVLPSVVKLQEGVAPLMIDGWNCSFQKDKDKIVPTKNQYTVRQLLSGFFAFYSKFNFQVFVISPYLGRHLRKRLFASINELPDGLKNYKFKYVKNNSAVKLNKEEMCDPDKMCVQDFFDLGLNLTSSTSAENLENFQICCEYTRTVFDSETLELHKMLTRSLETVPKSFVEKAKARKKEASSDVVIIKEKKKPVVVITLSDDESVQTGAESRQTATSTSAAAEGHNDSEKGKGFRGGNVDPDRLTGKKWTSSKADHDRDHAEDAEGENEDVTLDYPLSIMVSEEELKEFDKESSWEKSEKAKDGAENSKAMRVKNDEKCSKNVNGRSSRRTTRSESILGRGTEEDAAIKKRTIDSLNKQTKKFKSSI